MRILSLKSMFAGVVSFLICLAGVSAAQAGVIFAGGSPTSTPAFSGIVFEPGGSPADFLTGGPQLFEPKAIVQGPNNNIYIMEASEPGEDGGSSQEFVYQYSPGGQFISVFVARADYGGSGSDDGEAFSMTFGPDGNLYLALDELSGGSDSAVLRFNGQTGAFIDIFLDDTDGGPNVTLSEPSDLLFDPAGNLYVADDDGILKFSSSGTLLGEVIDAGSEPLWDESRGLAWRNGRLFVANQDDNNVLVVDFNPDGSTSNVSIFVAAGQGGLDEALDVGFGPEGLLYVLSGDEDSEAVLRYSPDTGAFVDTYVDLATVDDTFTDPYGFVFFFEDVEVPLLSPWSMALLILAMVIFAAFVLVRRKRGAAA